MNIDSTWIYESPDGGATVYKRRIGASLDSRILETISPARLEEKRFHERWHKFRSILELAKDNSALEEMLHKVEMYYELSK
jgi:hypothetical protein